MRTLRLTAIIAIGLALGYAFSEANEPAKSEGHKAPCCEKAEKEGKKCDHKCCEKPASESKNCEHCGGKN